MGNEIHSDFEHTPQFENYKWGNNIETIRKIVLKKGHDLISSRNELDVIKYEDIVLNKKAEVELRFTLETRKLYSVFLSWRNISILDPLLRILASKYSEPRMLNREGRKRYRWESEGYLLEVRSRFSEHHEEVLLHYRCNYHRSLQEVELMERTYGKEVDRF